MYKNETQHDVNKTETWVQRNERLLKEEAVRNEMAEADEVAIDPECTTPFDLQVGGDHYKEYAISPYEFFFRNKISHHKSAIIRRILRYDHPTGGGKKDLDKIRHELDLIEHLDPII